MSRIYPRDEATDRLASLEARVKKLEEIVEKLTGDDEPAAE